RAAAAAAAAVREQHQAARAFRHSQVHRATSDPPGDMRRATFVPSRVSTPGERESSCDDALVGERSRQVQPPFERMSRTGRRVLEQIRSLGPVAWLRAEREPLLQGVKTTVACVIAWWIAARVLEARMPVLAPIG